MPRASVLQWIRRTAADSKEILRWFFRAALSFFIGLVLIISADKIYPPSLQQEVLALAGLVIAAAGFFFALFCHCLLIWNRLRSGAHRNRDDP